VATDFGKLLDKIKDDNDELQKQKARLVQAYEKLDTRLNIMKAGVRIEPYVTGKGGPVLGYKQYSDGWHMTTHLAGLADLVSEIPVVEAAREVQVALMPHVGGLLEKVSASIAATVKETKSATDEANRLISALP
jgi:hypothetical protein